MKFLKNSKHPFLSSFFFVTTVIYAVLFIYSFANGLEQSWKNAFFSIFLHGILSLHFYYIDEGKPFAEKLSGIIFGFIVAGLAVYILSIVADINLLRIISSVILLILIYVYVIFEIRTVKRKKKEENGEE